MSVLIKNIDAEILSKVLASGIPHTLEEKYIVTHEVHCGLDGLVFGNL